jgi:hypothetical protein
MTWKLYARRDAQRLEHQMAALGQLQCVTCGDASYDLHEVEGPLCRVHLNEVDGTDIPEEYA